MYNFEEILSREKNGSKKWNLEYINKRFPGCKSPYYPLFIADMDYRLPKEIIDKFVEFIQQCDFGYFDIMDEFYQSIINWYKIMNDLKIEKEWIIPGIGTISSINMVIKSILNKEDNVLIFTPVYGPFKSVVVDNGLNLITQPLELKENKYYIDINKLEDNIINDDVKCILFCNPHNPSGRVWSKDEVQAIVNICKKYNVLLVSDEVHSDLVLYGNEFTSLQKFGDIYDNIIVSSSPNKSFNLAGLNSSYLLIKDKDNYHKVEKGFSDNKVAINRVGYNFISECYQLGEPWVKQLRKNIEENISIVISIFEESDVEVIMPQAGYLLWIRLNKIENTLEFVSALAKDTGVLVEAGNRFVEGEEGYIRINLATSKEILRISINEIVKYYKQYV